MKLRTIAEIGAGFGLAASLFAIGASAPPAAAAQFVRVSTSGSDSAGCGATNDPCRTIGQGIANVDVNGLVQIEGGTYVERVAITKPLTLRPVTGTGAVVIGDGTVLHDGPGLLHVAAAGGNVDVANFEVRGASNSGSGDAYGIYLDSASTAGTSIRVAGMTVTGVGAGGHDYGLYCEDSEADLEISNNEFSGSDNNPILIEGCTGAAEITGNDIDKTAGTAPSSALFVMNNFGRTSHGNHVVTDNDVTGGNISYVVGLAGLTPGGFAGIAIEDNTVTGGGVSLSNQATNANASAGVLQGVLIRANTLQGTGSGNGVSVSGNVTGTEIVGNIITGYANGLRQATAAAPATHGPTGTTARSNRIVANTVGATSAGPLTAENNWWGCNAGPAGCAPTTGPVDSDPWIVLRMSASPTAVLVNDPSTINANFAHNSNGVLYPGTSDFRPKVVVHFATDLGTLSATAVQTFQLAANTTFTSATPGTATVTATVDGQALSTTVTVSPPPPPPRVCSLIRLAVSLPGFAKPIIVLCI